MSELIVALYPDEQRAAAVLASLHQQQIISPLNLIDAVVVTRTGDGKVKLHRRTVSTAVVGDAFWQMLIGFLFLTPTRGPRSNTNAGSPWRPFSDYGIDDAFVQELDSQVTPGSSAVFVLGWGPTPNAEVVPEISKFGGKILRTGLGKEVDLRLRDAMT